MIKLSFLAVFLSGALIAGTAVANEACPRYSTIATALVASACANEASDEIETEAVAEQAGEKSGLTIEIKDEHGASKQIDLKGDGVVGDIIDKVLKRIDHELESLPEEQREEAKAQILLDMGSDDDPTSLMEGVIALVALTFSLGMPIIIVAIVMYTTYRKRRLMHETIRAYVAEGKEIAPEVLEKLGGEPPARNNMQSGVLYCGVGVGLGLFLLAIKGGNIASLALIPLFIGLAKLLIWKLESRAQAEQ